MANFRIDMISEETKRALDDIIRNRLSDPRIQGTFSVTRADVTRDLRHCKVFVSIMEEDLQEPFMKALKNAAGFIRSELGRTVALRYTPELHFERDKNIAYGMHIAGVLKQVLKEEDTPHDAEL